MLPGIFRGGKTGSPDGQQKPLMRQAGIRGQQRRRPGKGIFLNERSGNVYENKGPLWKTPDRSGNVFENKGVSCLIRECI